MPSAEDQGMIPLDQLSWPMTFRFHLSTEFGFTWQDLTLDIPDFRDHLEATTRFAPALWRDFVSSLTTASTLLEFTEVVEWKRSPLPQLLLALPVGGKNTSRPAKQEESGVIVLHTAHTDRWSRRRFYLPGMPRSWQDQRRLSEEGISNIYAGVAILQMGFLAPELPRPFSWYIAYPDMVERTPANLVGVAFRAVEWIRICSHTSKPPEGAGTDWP